MTLDEAIKHCWEIAQNTTCADCRDEHIQLAGWLLELKGRRKKSNDVLEKITTKTCCKSACS